MDITYNWSISGVDGTPYEEDGKLNVVRVIHWRCSGYPTGYESISNSRGGFVVLDEPSPQHTFIDYKDLTEQIIMGWLFEHLDKQAVESGIEEQLSLAPLLLTIKNKSPLWMHWDPNLPPEPPAPPPIDIDGITQPQ